MAGNTLEAVDMETVDKMDLNQSELTAKMAMKNERKGRCQ